MAVTFPGEGQIWAESTAKDMKPKTFSFNVVFEGDATQEDVMIASGMLRLIEMGMDGYSTTVFCYGQTGSGKTHTLTGPPGLFKKMDFMSEDHGLIFRSFVHLFRLIEESKEDVNYVLRASYLEIYNEQVKDLLNPNPDQRSLQVRWSKKVRGFYVENLFTVECNEIDDLVAVLEEGLSNRHVRGHNLNEFSSRSHTILTVHITQEQQESEEGIFLSKHGKINFVDLAGSEKSSETQTIGKSLEEANNINKSLLTLGTCISALSDPKKKSGHIPYRDSKLTKLLADSLGGNGVTLMVACISPAKSSLSESLCTLRYAARAKRIKTKPIVIMDPREKLIISLKREVAALELENSYLKAQLGLAPDATLDLPVPPPKNDVKIVARKMPVPDSKSGPGLGKRKRRMSIVNVDEISKMPPEDVTNIVKVSASDSVEVDAFPAFRSGCDRRRK
ncbi:unnamed protein product [Darwinula stevensoni]|uniref:Kinesin-like protein n=1 Tax=Darwinula stevensoni TaxID=69355 RepID=A0A7R8X8G8_9CRUS|nr:unnamed protein product [Darwinula stevensoni]CAG0890102.1 unnamed protein product [Darwinula stevensoni]